MSSTNETKVKKKIIYLILVDFYESELLLFLLFYGGHAYILALFVELERGVKSSQYKHQKVVISRPKVFIHTASQRSSHILFD